MSTTILVVGEHSFLRSSLNSWLEIMFPTAHIIDAADEAEGIALAQSHSPELVILDAGLRDLETYVNTVVDSGLNASTFTAKVIISNQQANSLPILYFQRADPSKRPFP
jgi:DNA-binding NarL/FixJ family response regulator